MRDPPGDDIRRQSMELARRLFEFLEREPDLDIRVVSMALSILSGFYLAMPDAGNRDAQR